MTQQNTKTATEESLHSLHRQLTRSLSEVVTGASKPLPASLIKEIRMFLSDNDINASTARPKVFPPLEKFELDTFHDLDTFDAQSMGVDINE